MGYVAFFAIWVVALVAFLATGSGIAVLIVLVAGGTGFLLWRTER